jgi:hypothetical protein
MHRGMCEALKCTGGCARNGRQPSPSYYIIKHDLGQRANRNNAAALADARKTRAVVSNLWANKLSLNILDSKNTICFVTFLSCLKLFLTVCNTSYRTSSTFAAHTPRPPLLHYCTKSASTEVNSYTRDSGYGPH